MSSLRQLQRSIGLAAALLAAIPVSAVAEELAAELDCLRTRNLTVVSAHRGRTADNGLENALSSLKAAHAAGIPLLEIDVAQTRDGVPVLLHDDTLDRTTTGTGPISAVTMEQLRGYRLKAPNGKPTGEPIPTLAQVLEWGRWSGARFQLDVKPTASFEAVVQAVRAAKMIDQVLVITYNLEDALKVHRLEPRLLVSTTIHAEADLDTLRREKFDLARLIAWTGTRQANPALWDSLRRNGVEPVFGTLGRPGRRLDDRYAEDGNPSEYADLSKAGATLIATDAPMVAQKVLGDRHTLCMDDKQ